MVGAYAAYYIDNRGLYDLVRYICVEVFVLFIAELLMWKTVKMREAMFLSTNAVVGLL